MFVREIGLGPDELLRALLLLETERRVHVLDSGGARPPDARFLIAGFDPFETIEARGEQLRITGREAASGQVLSGDVLALLNERLRSYSQPHTTTEAMVPACGACIATFSYDLQASLFDRPRNTRAPSTTFEPDATLAFFDTLVIHDYARGVSYLASRSGPEPLEQTFRMLMDAASSRAPLKLAGEPHLRERATRRREADALSFGPSVGDGQVASNFTREEYLAAVERIKERIAAGDIYQANLTQQLSVTLDAGLTPETIFLRLREEHPASFAAFIRRPEDVVVSASPERFLRVGTEAEGQRYVEAWPIKGTRARGAGAAEDERLRRELQESEKDRAENVMIVDLLRNDLGRVCLYGSVHVPELCAIQEHPTLFHLVSKVRGRLRDDVEAGDLLRAAFPCGSITGAPKRRAMEIIEEVETAPRGLSMGAIGYFSFDGRMDLSVAIRTMVLGPGRARFNVGGGIVADSDPALEYEESLLKAQALLRALR